MYTEEDLRATLGALEDEAPDPGVVLARLARTRHRRVVRRRTAGVVAAAVLGVVVVGGSIVATHQADPPHLVMNPPVEQRFQFPFAVDEIPGYQVAYRLLDFNGPSEVWIGTNLADPEDKYTLTVFAKGRYDPADAEGGEPVQVKGRAGSYRPEMTCVCGLARPDIKLAKVPGVAWEYAPDSWALVQYLRPGEQGHLPNDVREMSLRIANAVRFDRTAPVRVPFRLGYLPAEVRPVFILAQVDTVFPSSLGATLHLVEDDRGLVIDAGVGLGERTNPDRPIGEPVVAGGSPPTVGIVLGQIGVQVLGDGYSVDELKKIASSATAVADVYDLTSWFAADEALPLHP